MQSIKNQPQHNDVEMLKVPPHSLEAEQSLIGSLLLSNESFDAITDKVSADDFYIRANKILFQVITEIITATTETGSQADLITVTGLLEERDQLKSVGGFSYVAEIVKNTPSAANAVGYANIIRSRAEKRELISFATDIHDKAFNTNGDVSIAEWVEARHEQIVNQRLNRNSGSGLKPATFAMNKMVDHLERVMESGSEITGVSTGYPDLDKLTSGLQDNDLVIVAARPSMGKTTFAMNLIEHIWMESDLPSLVFSLEMPEEQLMMRMAASQGRIPLSSIRNATLDDEQWTKLSSVMGLLSEKQNLLIDDTSGLTPTDMRARARKVFREHGGIASIMVDYLQLMRVPGMESNRTLEISEISRSLKSMAKEFKCPVIALSQLNRTLESRSDKRPINSDLRESGSIEQDADLIMFIYRDEVYNEDSLDKGTAEIIIGKQRQGPLGSVRLVFNGQFSRFDNLDIRFRDEY